MPSWPDLRSFRLTSQSHAVGFTNSPAPVIQASIATIQLVSNRFWWSTLQPDVTQFRSAMWSLQYFQIRPSSSSRSPTASSHSSTTLVPYCNRFRNRPTQFQSLHHNTHGYWPILQGLPINSPHETTHSIWNGRSTYATGIQVLRSPRGHRLR